MADKPEPKEEGTSTLAAQYTRQAITHIVQIIVRERAKGTPDATIQKALSARLADYDEHSRALLAKLAAGGEIPDDFAKETVADSKQLKPNTTELTLTVVPTSIRQYSLVRYLAKEWMVVEIKDKVLTLKLL